MGTSPYASYLSSTNALRMSVTTKPTTATTTIITTDTRIAIRTATGLPLTRAVCHDSPGAAMSFVVVDAPRSLFVATAGSHRKVPIGDSGVTRMESYERGRQGPNGRQGPDGR